MGLTCCVQFFTTQCCSARALSACRTIVALGQLPQDVLLTGLEAAGYVRDLSMRRWAVMLQRRVGEVARQLDLRGYPRFDSSASGGDYKLN